MTREEMEKYIGGPLCKELYDKLKNIYDKGYQDCNKALEQKLDKIRAEIEQEIACKPMEMWDYRMGLTKALGIIDKHKTESEAAEQ